MYVWNTGTCGIGEKLRGLSKESCWREQQIGKPNGASEISKKNEGKGTTMLRMLLLTLTLVLSAAWLQAQDQYGSQAGSSQSGTNAAAGQKTVQGCLQSSDGNYTLTDKSGTTYQLQGDTSKLSAHVGHEVQITGKTSSAGATSSAMGTQAGGTQQPILAVQSMKHISKTCKSAAAK